jgi:hypothetical protein
MHLFVSQMTLFWSDTIIHALINVLSTDGYLIQSIISNYVFFVV